MHVDLLHPTRFLKSAEFKGRDVTFTIADVALEELERDDNSKETKGVVSFRDTQKMFLLNRTNSDCLKAMFGPETDNWRGKRVTFYPMPMKDPFTKEMITAIRVRGSPDIKQPVSVTIKLRKRKPQVMTMQITGTTTEPVDHVEQEKDAIRATIDALPTPAEMDAAWSSGLSNRIGRLPLAGDKEEMKRHFSARKGMLSRSAAKPPESVEAPPPAEEAPAAA